MYACAFISVLYPYNYAYFRYPIWLNLSISTQPIRLSVQLYLTAEGSGEQIAGEVKADIENIFS